MDGATRDYGEDRVATYEGAIQRDIEIAKNFLAKRQTPFWQFSYDVLHGVLERCKAASDNLHDLIGWSNLVKIGDIKGDPTQRSLEKQAGLCIDQLRVEISALHPNAIVVPTGNCAENEILYPVFHRDGRNWDNADYDRVAFKRDPETGTLVVWTNHPQSMGPSGYRTAATRMTVELVARVLPDKNFPAPALSKAFTPSWVTATTRSPFDTLAGVHRSGVLAGLDVLLGGYGIPGAIIPLTGIAALAALMMRHRGGHGPRCRLTLVALVALAVV